MSKLGCFLVLSRDESLYERLRDQLSECVALTCCHDELELSRSLVSKPRWSGMVLDFDVCEGDPLELLVQLRVLHPLVPVLGLASRAFSDLINGAQVHRVELLAKPAQHEAAVEFALRALAASRKRYRERIAAWVRELRARRGLDDHEADLFPFVLGDETDEQVIARWATTDKVFRAQVRSLLRKCNARTVDSLAKRVIVQSLRWDGTPKTAALLLAEVEEADDDEERASDESGLHARGPRYALAGAR